MANRQKKEKQWCLDNFGIIGRKTDIFEEKMEVWKKSPHGSVNAEKIKNCNSLYGMNT